MIPRPPRSTRTDTLFPYTTLFRSGVRVCQVVAKSGALTRRCAPPSPATQERGWLSAIRQARKFIGLVLLRQPLDQRVQRALEHVGQVVQRQALHPRSDEHTSELQSLMRHSYAVFCLKKKKNKR